MKTGIVCTRNTFQVNVLSGMVCSQGAECLKMVLPCYRTEFNLRARADVKLFAL